MQTMTCDRLIEMLSEIKAIDLLGWMDYFPSVLSVKS